MLSPLRNLPIKSKLMRVILYTTSFALLLMGGALIAYEVLVYRGSLARSTEVLARIIGANSTAALAFQDPEDANEVLSALSAEDEITGAAIYDREGKLFAKFPRERPDDSFPSTHQTDGHEFSQSHLHRFNSISQKGEQLGTIYLEADLSPMYTRFRVYGGILILTGVLSIVASMAVSRKLQRSISEPLLALAELAREVSQHQNYSIRGTKHGNDEIGDLTDSMNHMLTRTGMALDAAEAANKAKDNFLAVLSHELRTPLTPVLATVALLEQEKNLSPQVLQYVQTIKRSIDVEARLIDDLLDITRIERGKLELHQKTVDVRQILELAIKNYCNVQAEEKHITVQLEVTATEVNVMADESRMTQVFWNLLQNAYKFTPQGGTIRIGISNEVSDTKPRPWVKIDVMDSGIGIEPDLLKRIFDAFEQGDRSRTRLFGGLGLGLAISRALVEFHGGTIIAYSKGKGEGSCFTVRLPTVDKAVLNEDRPIINPASDTVSARTAKILLVEDHVTSAEQLSKLLQSAGHQVTWKTCIDEALQAFEIGKFDLLVSDLGLPDGSGHDLMRTVSERYRVSGIALSGYGMDSDIQESVAAGFSKHLTKPINWDVLKAEIQTVLNTKEPV